MTQSVSYVRDTMLPAQDPPALQSGPVKWVLDNLFSGWLNTILTLVSLYVIYQVLSGILPWMFGGIWDASSLTQCREIRDTELGGKEVACWAVIASRWKQLLFGFYPPESYWRVVLALVLFLAAVAPILFSGLPRKMLWLAVVAPFVVFWLLWGGTIWGPICVALGFVLGWAVLTYGEDIAGELAAILGAILIPILYWLFLAGPLARGIADFSSPILGFSSVISLVGATMAAAGIYLVTRRSSEIGATLLAIVAIIMWWAVVDPYLLVRFGLLEFASGAGLSAFGIEYVPSKQFGGFMLSFILGMSGIVLSLPIGIMLALGRQSDLFIINKFSVIFIEVIRGVPLIVWLFTASLLLAYFLPPGTSFDILLRVVIMVTLFSSAYIAEVIRGGLAALPRGQYEGADSLGLDYWQSMRLIILPQALKISIPGIVNTFIGLFKDTTLVAFIGLLDPIGLMTTIRATTDWNGIYWELFVFIGLLFFICCFSMSRYSQYLEKTLRTDHR